jgi:uncharacterized repeat protein (TIGR03837 family)
LVAETLSAVALWGGAGGALSLKTADIFCRVIDNFGDAGVAWRLGAQLTLEHDFLVRIFIDLPEVLAKIAPQVFNPAHPTIHHWNEADTAEPAELVLSTFCCRVPEAYVGAMHAQPKKPVWINVEYLSAEPWVETHHKLPSLRPDGLIEYFFYPGFTEKTGGLLREQILRVPFNATPASFHVEQRETSLSETQNGIQNTDCPLPDSSLRFESSNPIFTTSVFAYETESIHALIAGMNDVGVPVKLLVPFGRLSEKMGLFAPQVLGCVVLEPIPFTDQAGYDQLLARCNFNIVRGEDSFVRAQWAAKPFLWHIYPQAENAHVAKLQAWLERFGAQIPTAQFRGDLACFFQAWNAQEPTIIRALWPTLYARREAWQRACVLWRARLSAQPDLATQLIEFANKISSELQ